MLPMSDGPDRIEALPPKSKGGPITVILDETGTKIRLPFTLSVTSFEGYVKCPRQWFYRNILGEIRPPGIAMVQGTGGHRALEVNNKHKMKKGEDLSAKKVVEVFRDSWSDLSREVHSNDWALAKTDKNKAEAEVSTPLKFYMDRVAAKIVPTAVEKKYEGKAGGVPYTGTVDVEIAGATLDYKVCGPRSSYLKPETAEQSLQLSLYSCLSKQDRTGYLALVRGRAEFRRVPSTRNKEKRNSARKEVVHIAKAISAGSFPMCPVGSWYCNSRWCGYVGICPRWSKGNASKQP